MLLTLLAYKGAKPPPVVVPPKADVGFVGGVSRMVTSADVRIVARKMRKKRDDDDFLTLILS